MNIKDLKQKTKTLVGNPLITTEVFGGQADQYVFSLIYHKKGETPEVKLLPSAGITATDLEKVPEHYITLDDLLMFSDETEILIEGEEPHSWTPAQGLEIDYDHNRISLHAYVDSITLAELIIEARKHGVSFDKVHIHKDAGEALHITGSRLLNGNCTIYLDECRHEEIPSSGPCSRRPPKYKKVTPQFLFEYFQENVPYISITLEIVKEFLNLDIQCEKVEPNIGILTDLLRDYILSQNIVSAEDIEE